MDGPGPVVSQGTTKLWKKNGNLMQQQEDDMDGVAIPTPRIQRETAKLQIEQQQTNLSTQTTGSLKSRDVNMSVSSFLTSGIIQFKWKVASVYA